MRCTLCPRRCGAERTAEAGSGYCGMPAGLRVAKAMLHRWEEPPISGTNGAGAVFFSGCTLQCAYCQNGDISRGGWGKDISTARLREIFEDLIAQGAHNIELVTPTHFLPWILPALTPPLPVPLVYNCGGYERVETLKALEGKVDVYLPDLKYADSALAASLSDASDYFPVATAAIEEMYRQTGDYVIENGLLKRGVVIRHLVLPGHLDNTRAVLDWVAATFRPGQVLLSLMRQYTPTPNMTGTLARRVSGSEYRAAAAYMENCGIVDGFLQDAASAQTGYTPDFDGEGV